VVFGLEDWRPINMGKSEALPLTQSTPPLSQTHPSALFLDAQMLSPLGMLGLHRRADYSWTTGGDLTVLHLKRIDGGGYGEVHQVRFSCFNG
jgi:hypothetical protein